MIIKTYDSKMSKLNKESKFNILINDLFFKHPWLFLFRVVCLFGCLIQLLHVINEFLRYNIVVEIDIDSSEHTYLPAITFSNDFFMFLNMSKIEEKFPEWKNLSTLAKTRNFLSLTNITSAFKFEFLYNPKVLFENCTVYDIYSSNLTQENEDQYDKISEQFRTETVSKEQFSKINLSTLQSYNPPYVKEYSCLEIADFYLRTEYKDLSGWSDHLWYLTMFYRPTEKINSNKYKFTKMGNELLFKLKWELLVNDEIEFGFKIHLHSPAQAPNSKHAATLGINGKPYKWVTIGYSHSIANFLKPPFKTNCVIYTDYNFTSRQDCIDSCKIELSKNHCNNTLPLFTLMEPKFTADFINKKENVNCFYKYNINLFCEQKCYRKDCHAEYYTASILSEVSQSKKSLVIDVVKPNSGINQEFNYTQKMKALELLLYAGSTLSLWFAFSIVSFSNYINYFFEYFKLKKKLNNSKSNILKRARNLLNKRSSKKQKSITARTLSNRTLNSLLGYRNLSMINKFQKDGELNNYKDKLNGFNYDHNLDYNYKQQMAYYDNQMMNNQQIKFIILRDKNNN